MDKTTNSLNWFEIPATDLKRATKFYESIFAFKMEPMGEMMGMKMTGFPFDPTSGKASGALVKSKLHKPSKAGCVIYLNANPKLLTVLGRVAKAGGKVVMPKTQVSPEIGYMAFITDTEGNKVALHANS